MEHYQTMFNKLLQDPSILIGILIITITTVFRKTLHDQNSILFIGLPSSGKTCLINKLTLGKLPSATYTTQTVYKRILMLNNKTIHLYDIPGHPKLRNNYQIKMKNAKMLVFVIDSVCIQENLVELCSFLLSVIHFLVKTKSQCTLIIACHKADELLAFPKEKVQKMIENEIQKYQNASYHLTDEDEAGIAFVQSLGAKFTFEELSDFLNVEFLETNVTLSSDRENTDEDELFSFIAENWK